VNPSSIKVIRIIALPTALQPSWLCYLKVLLYNDGSQTSCLHSGFSSILKNKLNQWEMLYRYYRALKKQAAGLSKPVACNGFIILDYLFLELNSGN
jgi:hypothetical protein